jgi:hypothetical protein
MQDGVDPNEPQAPPEDLADSLAARASSSTLMALLLAAVNTGVWFLMIDWSDAEAPLFITFSLLAVVQLVFGIRGVMFAVKSKRVGGSGSSLIGAVLLALGAPIGWLLGSVAIALDGMGGAWGRPLRIRGRQLHPELREGSDWTRGAQPNPEHLDTHTRATLEALWLHDAQKEHASVPAFSRISWLLAAVGAPAELLEWSHRAALEEIEHTRLCFALAAGYGGRSHSVEPMPELLLGMEAGSAPLVTLALESLGDGCQLEDFNADVAAACARVCREPVTRAVLERIAEEERSHAEFSWALLGWLLERDADRVRPAIENALERLHAYPRPTAVPRDKLVLVALADADALLAHGRLSDARWGELWEQRLRLTNARVRSLLDNAHAPSQAA